MARTVQITLVQQIDLVKSRFLRKKNFPDPSVGILKIQAPTQSCLIDAV